MLLLEHDAKTLLARAGVPIPEGALVTTAEAGVDVPGPWMVKAQVPTGGRGKAGGIRTAETPAQLREEVQAILGMDLKGHAVRACRIEQHTRGDEAYLSMIVDPAAVGIRLLISLQGGMDIEALHQGEELVRSVVAGPDAPGVADGFEQLLAPLPPTRRAVLRDAASRLATAFFRYEATLLEINPLFLLPDGSWLAGDAKMILDLDAAPRVPEIAALIDDRADAYPESWLKLHAGFDYAEIDHGGSIGMLTTGAGLSMMLMDELSARGLRPFNFLDIRTGQMRGDPRRLIEVLNWVRKGPNVRVILVNVFAGITNLGEFARLLVQALRAVSDLRVPVVARIIGNGFDEARAIIAEATDLPILIEPDLDRALDEVVRVARA